MPKRRPSSRITGNRMPRCRPRGERDLLAVGRCLALRQVAALSRRDRDGDRQRRPQHERRDDAGGEQAADRDLADRAVQDEADPRRNDRRHQRAVRQHAGGIAPREAALEHLQAEHARLHRRIGDGGARDAAHQRGQRDRPLRPPPCIRPVSTVASSSSWCVMPELLRKLPARMNSGTASSAKFCVSVTVSWIGMVDGSSGCCRKNSAARDADGEGHRHAHQQQHGEETISIGDARSSQDVDGSRVLPAARRAP